MGLAISGARYRWAKRTIPYSFASNLGCRDAAGVAVTHWNANSCIRFVPHSGQADYVQLERQEGHAVSAVGRRGGRQAIGLGDTCSVGIIIHELGHTVGLWHEQCRSDRDQWVEVDWSNVEFGCEDNFAKGNICGEAVETVDLGGYDYGSIMHYGERTFAIDPRDPTLKLLRPVPAGVVVGQRKGLSPGDIAAVEKIYRDI